MRRLKAVLLSSAITAALTVGSGASAQSLTDALIQAYRTSPLLESSRAALRSIDENVPQARANRRPQVDVGVSANTSSTVEGFVDDQINNSRADLNASLLIYDSGATSAAIEAARNSVAAGRADLKDVEQFVLFSAVQAYADVRRDEEFVRLARNDVERLSETQSATVNRFEVGEVTRTDVSQSDARLAESRATLVASQGSLEISREAYRAAVGTLPQNLERLPPLPQLPASLDQAVALGMQRNPQIIAARFNERVAVYDFDRALAAKGPTLSVVGSVGAQRGDTGLAYDGNTFGEIGVQGSMPLYTGGRNDSLIRQAQAILNQRRSEVQDAGRSVTQDVSAAWAEVDVARATIVARREQAEASRVAAEGVAEEARLGARSTLDVLDAIQDQLQAEAEVVRSMRDEYVAAYGLLRAMGLLTVQHLNLGIEPYDPDINYAQVQSGRPGGYDTSAVDRIRARWERN